MIVPIRFYRLGTVIVAFKAQLHLNLDCAGLIRYCAMPDIKSLAAKATKMGVKGEFP